MSRKAGAYLAATLLAAIATLLALLLQRLPHANLSLLFLTVVIIVAARWGLWPSIYASLVGFLSFNFLFTPPLYTLTVENEGDVATLIFFLAMAALTGNLASRMRDAVARRQAALDRVSILYGFSRRVAAAARDQEIVLALIECLSGILHCPVAVLLTDSEGSLAVRATTGTGGMTEAPAADAATRAWRDEQNEVEGTEWRFLPLATANGRVGLVAMLREFPDDERRELVEHLCSQAAVGIERTSLAADLAEAKIETETEQLRSALLSSVSHDLRTPLSSIIGSATSLIEYGEAIKPDDRRELLEAILDESERLNRYIQNLLDMTRLGRGNLSLRRDWVDLNDVLSAAMDRLRREIPALEVDIEIEPDAALLYVHAAMLEQVFVNLLDNAARFSPPGGTISITARKRDGRVLIDVLDEGPGIPASEQEKVFDMFYSADMGKSERKGTGLGLAICRGLLGAHGGDLVALDGPGGIGTCMRISLPYTPYRDP
ncbi:MAG TPA: DUF4118 domain-containing protein [Gammaproteobacteria bacterium]